MKNTNTIVTLLGTTSILALVMAASGVATAADMPLDAVKVEERILSGSMGLYGAYTFGICHSDNCNGDTTTNDSWFSLGGFGNVSVPFDDGLALQLGFHGEAITSYESSASSNDYAAGVMATAHFNYREPEQYLFGAFGGLGAVHMGSSNSSESARHYLAGVEGQYHVDDWTFYGQAALAGAELLDSSTNTDFLNDGGVYLRGAVRHYFNDGMTKLQGDVIYVGGEQSRSDDIDAWSFGVEVEHTFSSFDNGNISAFGRFDAFYANESNNGDDAEQLVIRAGLRANFGYENLYQRDHYGEGVDVGDINRLHAVIRSTD